MDDPLPDEGNELYDGNWEDLEESILDEDNVPQRDMEEEASNQQQEEPPSNSTFQVSVTDHNIIQI